MGCRTPVGLLGLYTSWHGMAWHVCASPHMITLSVPRCEQGVSRRDTLRRDTLGVFVGGV